uniref:NADH dehydrogenase subunit 6 n=1 Tax=Onukigallia onukii TaxID=1792642 RepID=UPI003003A5E7|nr:NADH dehydrogenase subunit 6 [Onukigallia onukii]
MKLMLLKTMMMISMMSLMMKNPMSMGISLLMQTIVMITLMNKISSSSWFPMITFLMMIGGLMILFMYMSSIASNEKFKMNLKTTMMIIIMMILTDEMMMNMQTSENQSMMMSKSLESLSMNKLYSKTFTISMIMVIFLLLTMISISKMVKHYEGPLRSKHYE